MAYHSCRGSFPGQSIRDMWSKRGNGRGTSGNKSGFPCQLYFHQYSIFIHLTTATGPTTSSNTRKSGKLREELNFGEPKFVSLLEHHITKGKEQWSYSSMHS
jgi:hypothetical protein